MLELIKLVGHQERLIITAKDLAAAYGHFEGIEIPHYDEYKGNVVQYHMTRARAIPSTKRNGFTVMARKCIHLSTQRYHKSNGRKYVLKVYLQELKDAGFKFILPQIHKSYCARNLLNHNSSY